MGYERTAIPGIQKQRKKKGALSSKCKRKPVYLITDQKTRMKRVVFVLIAVVFLSTGCFKEDNGCSFTQSTTVAPANEQVAIEEYLAANSITATKHSSGMYYEIFKVEPGGSQNLCP